MNQEQHGQAGEIQPPPRRLRWKRWAVVVGLLLLVWFAPTLIGISPLRNTILNRLLGDFHGHAHAGRMSLGWLSPVVIGELELTDADDATLLSLEELRTEKALLAILTHPSDPGEIHIRRPTIHLTLREQQFNWETAIAPMLDQPSGDGPVLVKVVVQEGQVILRDEQVDRTHEIQIDELEFENRPAPQGPRLAVRISHHSDGDQVGSLAASWEQQQVDSNGMWQVGIEADNFDATYLSTCLARVLPECEIEGTFGGEILCRPDETTPSEQFEIAFRKWSGRQVRLTAPSLLQTDEVTLNSIRADGRITYDHGRWQAEPFDFTCDVGTIHAEGIFDPQQLLSSAVDPSSYPDYSLDAEVDLSRLANMLPATLRLREGIQIERGQITLTSFSRIEAGERRLFVHLETADLLARSEDQVIRLQQPFQASASVKGAADQLKLEYIDCKSEFLQCNGAGTLSQGRVSGTAYLAKLFEQLEQFIELDETEIAGTVEFTAAWETLDSATQPENSNSDATTRFPPVELTMEATGQELTLKTGENQDWREPSLAATIRTRIGSGPDQSLSVNEGDIQIRSGEDTIEFRLRESVAWPIAYPLALDATIRGRLPSLLKRFEAMIPANLTPREGVLYGTGTCIVESESIRLEPFDVTVDQLVIDSPQLQLSEPQLVGQLRMDFQRSTGRLSFANSTLAGSTVSMLAKQLSYEPGPQGMILEGDIDFRADSFRLANWLPPLQSSNELPFGMVAGQLAATANEKGWQLAVVVDSELLQMASRQHDPAQPDRQWISLWDEPNVHAELQLSGIAQQQEIRVERMQVTSDSAHLELAGLIHRPAADCHLQLEGKMGGDLDVISQRLTPWTGGWVRCRGESDERLTVTGSLFPDAAPSETNGVPARSVSSSSADSTTENQTTSPHSLSFNAGVRWDDANLAGLVAGPATVRGELKNKVVRFDPIDLELAGGRFQAEPEIRLDGDTPRLSLHDTPLLTDIQLTPKLTQTWISLAAPILAGATRAQGRFSVHVNHADLPLTDPFQGMASGKLVVSQAQIGPGPLGTQLIQLVKQLRSIVRGAPASAGSDASLLVMPPQTIEYSLVNGRVHHQGMIFQIDSLQFTSRGSIGADQSIDLILSFRIPDRWLGADPIGRALAGAAFEIPVRGKLSGPSLDWNGLRDLLLRRTGSEVLQNELMRGLGRLLGDDR